MDPPYGTKHESRSAGPDDSPEKIVERDRIKDVARQVVDATIHLSGKDHLFGLVREKQLLELDRSNIAMKNYHELTPGGIEAPLAIILECKN